MVLHSLMYTYFHDCKCRHAISENGTDTLKMTYSLIQFGSLGLTSPTTRSPFALRARPWGELQLLAEDPVHCGSLLTVQIGVATFGHHNWLTFFACSLVSWNRWDKLIINL